MNEHDERRFENLAERIRRLEGLNCETPEDQHKTSESNQEETANKKQEINKGAPVIPSGNPSEVKANNYNRHWYNSLYQWWKSRSIEYWKPRLEMLGVCFAIGYAIITFGQWRDSSNNFITDQRAWLHPESEGFPNPGSTIGNGMSFNVSSGERIQIPYRISNTGKTPALRVNGGFVVEIVPSGKEPQVPGKDEDIALPYEIAPKHKFDRPVVVNGMKTPIILPNEPHHISLYRKYISGDDRLTTEELNDLANRRSYLLIWGKVYYSDIFGKRHWMRFCGSPPIGNEPVSTPEKCTEYSAIDN
jgi:hypothetical protein